MNPFFSISRPGRSAPAERVARRATRGGSIALAVLTLVNAGCALGPAYQRPEAAMPAVWRQADGWVVAAPADTLDRGPWWQRFGDPVLDQLVSQVEVSNQNVAAASAAYAQARALVAEQRAGLFPVVGIDGGGSRSGGGGSTASRSNFQVSIGTSWEPDVWGRLRLAAQSAAAGAAASAADLAAARLSAQGELAAAYFGLRQSDAQKELLGQTIAGYRRSLQIASNRYAAGIVGRTDVLQAETQLASAEAESIGLARSRAQSEHAIAVLIGKAPGDFALAPMSDWQPSIPDVPVGIPSTLLQRRPDIAAAERRVAAANAQIGIARTAFYPSFGLNASAGLGASQLGNLFSASSLLWSLGVSTAQTLLDAGASRARVDAATAGSAQAVAGYRQTVLAALQDVENQLAATRVLTQQEAQRRQAANAADLVQAQVQNRYQAGQVSYTEVVTAQASALNARRSLVQLLADRQTTAVALIQSLGGGWQETP